MKFEWDQTKASLNWRRHRVAFTEAIEAFFDPQAIEDFDDEHSEAENRFRLVGMSRRSLLLVVYSEPKQGVIRIISARKAEKKQQKLYEQGN